MIFPKHFNPVTNLYSASKDLSSKHSTKVFAVVKVVHLESECTLLLNSWLWNIFDDCFQQQSHVHLGTFHIFTSKSARAASVKHREEQVVLTSSKVNEEVNGLVVGVGRPSVFTVNLVNANNRLESILKSLLKYKSGLGHRPFVGVDDQQNAVNHAQNSLNFSTNVSVARGVHTIDLGVHVANGGDF